VPVDDRSAERTPRSDQAPAGAGRVGAVALDVFTGHLLEGCADAVFARQPDQTSFAYVNPAAARLTGYSRRELLTMSPLDLTPGLGEDELRDILAPLVRGDVDAVRVERTMRTNDGSRVEIEADIAYFSIPRLGPYLVAVVRDVGGRAAAEAERRAADRARIADELNAGAVTQLFAAGLALHGVATRLDDPDVVHRITQAVDRIDEAIRQLRASVFARSTPADDAAGTPPPG
jgi:PAS domain S-box-containing protein